MISPVRSEDRSSAVGSGYSKEEVDSFLVNIAEEFERLYRENAELKEAVSVRKWIWQIQGTGELLTRPCCWRSRLPKK